MKPAGGGEVATVDEAAEALGALSDKDLARLNSIAKFRARLAPGLDWQDLLHGAVESALDGTRRWPRNLPFLLFMREVMRSMASEYCRKYVDGVVRPEADLKLRADGQSEYSLAAANDPDPEREAAARTMVEAIRAIFAGDDAALAVIAGLEQGSSPAEVQKKAGLTPTQYASAQKRIRRGLARTFPEGMLQ